MSSIGTTIAQAAAATSEARRAQAKDTDRAKQTTERKRPPKLDRLDLRGVLGASAVRSSEEHADQPPREGSQDHQAPEQDTRKADHAEGEAQHIDIEG